MPKSFRQAMANLGAYLDLKIYNSFEYLVVGMVKTCKVT